MKLIVNTPRTPQKTVEVKEVFLPGVEGSFEILSNHAPLIAALGPGEIRWDGGSMHVDGGFVKVLDNEISVVAD